MIHSKEFKAPKARRFVLSLVSFTSIEQSKRDDCPTNTYLHFTQEMVCLLYQQIRLFNGSESWPRSDREIRARAPQPAQIIPLHQKWCET